MASPEGGTGPGTGVRIGINFVVPFCVAGYGVLSARRVRP